MRELNKSELLLIIRGLGIMKYVLAGKVSDECHNLQMYFESLYRIHGEL